MFACITLASTSLPPSLPLTIWRAESWPLNTLQSFNAPKSWNLQYFQCMESPQMREFLVVPVHGVLWSHGCRTFAMDFFCPNSSVHATVSLRMLRAFSGDFSALEFRTQSRNEQARMESGWDFPVDFWFVAQIRVWIFLKDGALSSLSKRHTRQIYATQQILKSTPISKHFPNGFSGRSTLVCVAAFGYQYSYADQPKT